MSNVSCISVSAYLELYGLFILLLLVTPGLLSLPWDPEHNKALTIKRSHRSSLNHISNAKESLAKVSIKTSTETLVSQRERRKREKAAVCQIPLTRSYWHWILNWFHDTYNYISSIRYSIINIYLSFSHGFHRYHNIICRLYRLIDSRHIQVVGTQ